MLNLPRISNNSITTTSLLHTIGFHFHNHALVAVRVNCSSLSTRVRCISISISNSNTNSSESHTRHSFAFTHLVNKYGFSQESASAASKYLPFETPDKPDSVIAFLQEHGFSIPQIQQIIRVRPHLLHSDVDKSLLPKLDFFRARGFSNPHIIKLLFCNPLIFSCSLDNKIIPCFDHLRRLLQSECKAVKAINRYPYILSCNFDTNLLPNITLLLNHGVPESNIRSSFMYRPRSFVMVHDRFRELVEEVKEMGFDPRLTKFLRAVNMLRKMSKSILEKKFDVYKKWGWSEQMCWEAFQRCPNCVEPSEEKIMKIMDFVVNKMGLQSLLVANQPSFLARSLQKRIVPRGLFVQDLMSKGFIDKFTLSGVFDPSEKDFLQKYVYRYEDRAPELLKLYNEKLNLAVAVGG